MYVRAFEKVERDGQRKIMSGVRNGTGAKLIGDGADLLLVDAAHKQFVECDGWSLAPDSRVWPVVDFHTRRR